MYAAKTFSSVPSLRNLGKTNLCHVPTGNCKPNNLQNFRKLEDKRQKQATNIVSNLDPQMEILAGLKIKKSKPIGVQTKTVKVQTKSFRLTKPPIKVPEIIYIVDGLNIAHFICEQYPDLTNALNPSALNSIALKEKLAERFYDFLCKILPSEAQVKLVFKHFDKHESFRSKLMECATNKKFFQKGLYYYEAQPLFPNDTECDDRTVLVLSEQANEAKADVRILTKDRYNGAELYQQKPVSGVLHDLNSRSNGQKFYFKAPTKEHLKNFYIFVYEILFDETQKKYKTSLPSFPINIRQANRKRLKELTDELNVKSKPAKSVLENLYQPLFACKS